jgi:hypothetical protein
MLFSSKKQPPTLPSPLIMAGEDIKMVTTFKYLGVTLDSHLNWTCHLDHKIKQAKKYLMFIHQGLGTTWGPPPSIT